jgi:hypothetical protein
VLDEVPELEQTRYTAKTRDHEFVDLEIIKLLSRVYAFYEEERHVIMDFLLVPFHIKTCITRHVELQNVVKN